MKQPTAKQLAAILVAMLAPAWAWAFNSGSTGVDGALAPTVNTTIPLPANGILNYTSINIPVGVTVKFQRNTVNTPVTLLVQGDATVAGTIDVSGTDAPGVGSAGGGAQGDDGQPGKGGPGGFDGGRGGKVSANIRPAVQPAARGGSGLGPGSGTGGGQMVGNGNCGVFLVVWGGGGAGYNGGGGPGEFAGGGDICGNQVNEGSQGGSSYGSALLLPLIGGSGGGGGTGGLTYEGGGGGGGGGAILIAASGTLTVAGSILANGGKGGSEQGGGTGGPGGGGSGGAIRLMATTLAGNGPISANGGPQGDRLGGEQYHTYGAGGGAGGRIRLEAETVTRTVGTSPIATSDVPSTVFVAGLPTLTIASVAGQAAPGNPTGNADITLPAATVNPVTVVFTTTGVPVGNTVLLSVVPAFGPKVTAQTPALTGTTASATASVQISLPVGPSVLQAQTTYTVVASVGDLLRNFAGNERVERVTLSAQIGGKSKTTLITTSGKEFEANAEALAILARAPMLVAGS